MRKIVVDGQNWQFMIGRSFVKVVSPSGQGYVANHSEVTGRSWDTLERGIWKKTSDGMVTPANIEVFIRNLLDFKAGTK